MNRLFEINEPLEKPHYPPVSVTQSPCTPGCFIGMDEAGYGPNLGPLVIAATVWNTPEAPEQCDFATLLSDVVSTRSTNRNTSLHIADSKLVNVGKDGLRALEMSALALLSAAGQVPVQLHQRISLKQLRDKLCQHSSEKDNPFSQIPWYQDDLQLPVVATLAELTNMTQRLLTCMQNKNLFCYQIRAQVIPAQEFNTFLKKFGSKGVALSSLTFQLLQRVWQPTEMRRTLLVGDKHGGRNHYAEFLAPIAGDTNIDCVEEGQTVSRYRVNSTEFRFQTKGEQHLPVAAASVVAKYLRELSMLQFNRYWQQQLPELKPTKGYPVDARRFRIAIQEQQRALNITDTMLWREK